MRESQAEKIIEGFEKDLLGHLLNSRPDEISDFLCWLDEDMRSGVCTSLADGIDRWSRDKKWASGIAWRDRVVDKLIDSPEENDDYNE